MAAKLLRRRPMQGVSPVSFSAGLCFLLLVLLRSSLAASSSTVQLGTCSSFTSNDFRSVVHFAPLVALKEGFFDNGQVANRNFNVELRSVDTACTAATSGEKTLPLLLGQGKSAGRIYSEEVDAAPVVAIMGCYCSGVSMAVSQLAGSFKVPMVSASSTNPDLSNKASYPYFSRTVPPDSMQGAGLGALVAYYGNLAPGGGWTRIVLLYTQTVYAQGVADAFAATDAVENITVIKEPLPDLKYGTEEEALTYDYSKMTTIANRVALESPQPRVFVVAAHAVAMIPIVRAFRGAGLLDEKAAVLTSESFILGGGKEIDLILALQPTYAAASVGLVSEGLWQAEGGFDWGSLQYIFDGWLGLAPSTAGPLLASQEFLDFWTGLTREKLLDAGLSTDIEVQESWFHDTSEFLATLWNAYFFDSLTAILHGIGSLLEQGYELNEAQGELLNEAIFAASFEGLTGQIAFDENGDRLGGYVIYNLLDGATVAEIGTYDSTEDFLSFSADAIFPSGLTTVPRSRPEPCPAGYEYIDQACQACPAGEFAPAEDSECVSCPVGSYSPEAAASACLTSPLGTHVPETGSSNYTLCALGTFSGSVGASECMRCQAGFFADTMGATVCQWCPLGTYAAGDDTASCALCGDGEMTSDVASQSSEACLCSEGSYRPLSGSGCVDCEEGLDCAEGSDLRTLDEADGVYPLALAGYFTEENLSVFRCWGSDAARCVGGKPGETCAVGRTGIACGYCLEGRMKSSDGSCEECSALDSIPLFVVALLTVLVLVLFYSALARQDMVRQSIAATFVGLALGQLLTVTQQLSITSQMKIDWPEPMSTLLEVVAIFAFDVEVLRASCVMSSAPSANYLMRLLIFVACLIIVFIIHCLRVMIRKKSFSGESFNVLVCAWGTITLVFFIPVLLAAVAPFQCLSNPNGLETMRLYPSVICWDSSEHKALLTIGGIALLFPISYLALCTWAIREFPRQMRLGHAQFVKMFGFLFIRYRPKQYWYSLVHLFRSVVFSLTTVAPNPVLQILCIHTCLLGQIVLLGISMPWRVKMANQLDIVTMGGMMSMLCFAAFFVEGYDIKIVAYAAAVLVVVVTLVFVPAVIWGIHQRARHRLSKPFRFFLSHHKTGGGSLARLLKLMFQDSSYVTKRVFLDSDDLKDLATLFDYVGRQTDTLLVLCSREIFSRPWCVGEIVVAQRNDVEMVALLFPEFDPPDTGFMQNYSVHVPGCLDLAEHGILEQDCVEAMAHLLAQESCHVPSDLTDTSMKELVHSLATNGSSTLTRTMKSVKSDSSNVGIIADFTNTETGSSSMVLCYLLRPLLIHSPDKMPVRLQDPVDAPTNLRLVIVLCSNGVFSNLSVLSCIMHAAKHEASYIPVITDANFRFPTPAFFDEHRAVISQVTEEEPDFLLGVLQQVFRAIAVAFLTGRDSEEVLQAQAKEVVMRMTTAGHKLPTLRWVSTMRFTNSSIAAVAKPTAAESEYNRKRASILSAASFADEASVPGPATVQFECDESDSFDDKVYEI